MSMRSSLDWNLFLLASLDSSSEFLGIHPVSDRQSQGEVPSTGTILPKPDDRAAITFHRRPRTLTALSVLPDQVMNLILARCRSPRQGRKSSTWTSIDRG